MTGIPPASGRTCQSWVRPAMTLLVRGRARGSRGRARTTLPAASGKPSTPSPDPARGIHEAVDTLTRPCGHHHPTLRAASTKPSTPSPDPVNANFVDVRVYKVDADGIDRPCGRHRQSRGQHRSTLRASSQTLRTGSIDAAGGIEDAANTIDRPRERKGPRPGRGQRPRRQRPPSSSSFCTSARPSGVRSRSAFAPFIGVQLMSTSSL